MLREKPLVLAACAAVSVAVGTPRIARAQTFQIGGDLLFAKPVGQFGHNVKQGFGLAGFGLWARPGSPIALRADIDYVTYGRQTQQVIYNSVFGAYALEQTTSNNIFDLTIGPQLQIPVGPFRPYVNAQGGLSHFYTESSIDGLDPQYYNTNYTESSDWQLTYGFGGGFTIPVRLGLIPMLIDVGARYHVNGETSYLTKSDIQQDPSTGELTVTPRKTDARFVTYRLGVSIGL